MKYIKYFENKIDWDDWNIEEEEYNDYRNYISK